MASMGVARVESVFEQAANDGRAVLVAYTMGGDPAPGERFVAYADAILGAGADLLEVGIPFSDPAADGPTIQAAGVRALEAGTKVRDVLADVRTLREAHVETPIVVMTYANIAYTMGYRAFAQALSDAGCDGAIIPDVPLEEAGPLRDAFEHHGLALVLLVAPTTPDDRVARVAEATQGFLYVVGSLGTTGARDRLDDATVALVERVKPIAASTGKPFALGFGVSRPEHVAALREAGAPGVVVGSAIVARIGRGEPPEHVAAFVASLRAGAAPDRLEG